MEDGVGQTLIDPFVVVDGVILLGGVLLVPLVLLGGVEEVDFPNPFKQSVVFVDDDGVEVQGHGVVGEEAGFVVKGILLTGVAVLQVTMTAGSVCSIVGVLVNVVVIVVQDGYKQGVAGVILKAAGVAVVTAEAPVFFVVVPLPFPTWVNVDGQGTVVQGVVIVEPEVVETDDGDLEQFLTAFKGSSSSL